jgi:hypothetical protein
LNRDDLINSDTATGNMIIPLGRVESPDAEISDRVSAWINSGRQDQCFALNYALDTSWDADRNETRLAAIYFLGRSQDNSIRILAAVTDQVDELDQLITTDNADFDSVCKTMAIPVLDLNAPLVLETVVIPKPWGREIWYTGAEARGVSRIHGIPLPWVISLFKSRLVGQADAEPVLLKILDPSPEEVYGDLYFEMHTRKTEVYVVTHVDRSAWPAGRGQIRLGFSEDKLRQYPDQDKFKSAYLACVQKYQKIRAQIDARFDEYRLKEGIPPHTPVPANVLRQWHQRLPTEWLQQEQLLRADMNAFTGSRDLSVGDVISIAPLTPHALQHGVRTIEFQTPHYERKILSFAQKVLTQDHWDTETAIDEMTIPPSPQPVFEAVHQSPGILAERIADFEQFTVLRVFVDSDCSYQHQLDSYALVICVTGHCHVNGLELEPEQASLVPHGMGTFTINNRTSRPMQCLIASPVNGAP